MKRAAGVATIAALVFVGSAHAALKPLSAHRYQQGKNVKAVQWLLGGHKPSVYKIDAYREPIDGIYGASTVHAVKNMKYRIGYPANALNGRVAGRTFTAFLRGQRRPFEFRKRAGDRVVALAKAKYDLEHPPVDARIKTLVADAHYLISVRYLIGYTQGSARMSIIDQRLSGIPPLTHYIYEDCSSWVTGLYWLAGLPDPNGLGYNGYGYTGTQSAHGRVVWQLGQPISQLRAGDLIFYGGGWPHHHVAMYLGNGRVGSHGTNTGPFDLPIFYRPDAVGAHRYVG